jgi:hypothetical protein
MPAKTTASNAASRSYTVSRSPCRARPMLTAALRDARKNILSAVIL